MAYVTIPQLPAGVALTGLEQFEAVQSSTSVKLTAAQIKTFITVSPLLSINDTDFNGVSIAATLQHTTTGVPAIGIGTALAFNAETQSSINTMIATLDVVTTNITAGAENADFTVNVISAGALTEVMRATSNKRLGIGTIAPVTTLQAVSDDTANANISAVATFTHTATTTPATGIGTGIAFQTETTSGNIETGMQLASVATAVSFNNENFDFVVQLMSSGATAAEVARFTSTKRLGINTTTPSTALEAVFEDASTSSVVSATRVTRTSAGIPIVGIGTAIELATETAVGVTKVGGAIYVQSTSLASGAENFDLALGVMANGTATIEVVRVTSNSRMGVNTPTPAVTLHAVTLDNVLNTTSTVSRVTHLSTGVTAAGIGAAIDFEVQNSIGTPKVGSVISAEMTNVGSGTENFDLVFSTMLAGAAPTEKFRIASSVITPSVPFSKFGVGVAPSATCFIKAGTSSATIAPLCFDTTSPVLQTTAQNGCFDFDGDALYFTPQNLERGIIPTRQTYINTAGSRVGPNMANTAQTATFVANSSTITVTTAPGTLVGSTGTLVIFSGTTAPAGITFGQPYWVNFLTTTTITVSATQAGTPITPTTAGSAVTAIFHFSIFGNGITTVGVNLAANTRYMYEIYFAVSHTGAAGTSVAYALTTQSGTLSAHYYRVLSLNSTSAIVSNLTSITPTSQSLIANFVVANFATQVTVTGLTAATANTTNVLQIQGQIDTVSACTYVIPTIGFPVAPTLSTILQGAYMAIYPIGPVASNTAVGNWVT